MSYVFHNLPREHNQVWLSIQTHVTMGELSLANRITLWAKTNRKHFPFQTESTALTQRDEQFLFVCKYPQVCVYCSCIYLKICLKFAMMHLQLMSCSNGNVGRKIHGIMCRVKHLTLKGLKPRGKAGQYQYLRRHKKPWTMNTIKW